MISRILSLQNALFQCTYVLNYLHLVFWQEKIHLPGFQNLGRKITIIEEKRYDKLRHYWIKLADILIHWYIEIFQHQVNNFKFLLLKMKYMTTKYSKRNLQITMLQVTMECFLVRFFFDPWKFQESIHFWIKWDWSRVRKIVKKERRCNKVSLGNVHICFQSKKLNPVFLKEIAACIFSKDCLKTFKKKSGRKTFLIL